MKKVRVLFGGSCGCEAWCEGDWLLVMMLAGLISLAVFWFMAIAKLAP